MSTPRKSSRSTGQPFAVTMIFARFRQSRRQTGPAMSSQVDFHVKELAQRTTEGKVLTTSGLGCGLNSQECLAFFDLGTQSWRTYQPLLFGGLEEFSAIFPNSGLMQSGKLYQRPLLVRHTKENEFSLWPTAQASDAKRMRFSREAHLKQQARNRRLGFGTGPAGLNLVAHCQIEFAGYPTANFVEWLMGFQTGWTDIGS